MILYWTNHVFSQKGIQMKGKSEDSGKRRRSWRTQKYLLSDPIFSKQIIAGIHKWFSEANCILKMGNIWRSFWYAGIIILLLLSAGYSYQGVINPRNLLLDSRYKTPPKIGLDWLNKNANDGFREDYFCGLSKEEIKRESIWRPKDRVNSHNWESLKTALPYRW